MRLVDHLHQNARLYPQKVAVISDGKQLTYSQLSESIIERSHQYHAGQIVPFRTTQTADFIVTWLAIHQAGATAVPLEATIPEQRLQEITTVLKDCQIPEDTADILYTTGTTGQSKGVMISHRTIMANAENLIEGQGFTHDLTFIIHGPLNHIGSLSKLYPVILLGSTIYLIDGLKDIDQFFRALDYPAPRMATFLVPANIRTLLMFSADRLSQYRHKIDFIESGAAPLPRADMQRLCELLPETRLYNTYASTETGIIATYNFNDGRCLAGCLGHPMSHSRILITADGLIACQGDTLMSGYVGDPALTTSVLRDQTVYTSDIGRLDADGMLRLAGRESDVINVGGFKVAPTEVEDAAMTMEEISDCLCIAVPHPITGSALKLLVVTTEGIPFDKKRVARHLANLLERYKVPMLYEQTGAIKRTYNGKPDRKYYKNLVKNKK